MDDMQENSEGDKPDRRGFLTVSAGLMSLGLLTSYGAFGAVAARFLYPARDPDKAWLFVTRLADFKVGSAFSYKAPTGETVTIIRQGEKEFRALSSVCPHLGCQVHWEGHKNRFFCPCHNGVFSPDGKPVEGPPAEANQELATFPLQVEQNLLFIEVPVERVVSLPDAGPGKVG